MLKRRLVSHFWYCSKPNRRFNQINFNRHHVPDFVGVAWPNTIQIVWCCQCVQFSQVIFVLILESMKTLILQNLNYYVCMTFLTCLQPIFQFYTPRKHQWFLKGVQKWNIEVGSWLISSYKWRSVIFTMF